MCFGHLIIYFFVKFLHEFFYCGFITFLEFCKKECGLTDSQVAMLRFFEFLKFIFVNFIFNVHMRYSG